MLRDGALTVRELFASDLPALRRLVTTSEYIYCRFGLEELPRLLAHKPGVQRFPPHRGYSKVYGWRMSRSLIPAPTVGYSKM